MEEAELLLGVAPLRILAEFALRVEVDPAGPEPAQEYVELRNLGGEAVSLAGLRLEDAKGGDEPTVTASKITYNLNANKLTKQQVMNFFKLWIVSVGPTNDE